MTGILRPLAAMSLAVLSASCADDPTGQRMWTEKRVVEFPAPVPRQCVLTAVTSLSGFREGPDPYRLTMVDFESPISLDLHVDSWIQFHAQRVDVAFSGPQEETEEQKRAIAPLLDAEVLAIQGKCLH